MLPLPSLEAFCVLFPQLAALKVDALKKGTSIFIFPEGTRSMDGTLGRTCRAGFRPGGFGGLGSCSDGSQAALDRPRDPVASWCVLDLDESKSSESNLQTMVVVGKHFTFLLIVV